VESDEEKRKRKKIKKGTGRDWYLKEEERES
jgi:hypothetical protein